MSSPVPAALSIPSSPHLHSNSSRGYGPNNTNSSLHHTQVLPGTSSTRSSQVSRSNSNSFSGGRDSVDGTIGTTIRDGTEATTPTTTHSGTLVYQSSSSHLGSLAPSSSTATTPSAVTGASVSSSSAGPTTFAPYVTMSSPGADAHMSYQPAQQHPLHQLHHQATSTSNAVSEMKLKRFLEHNQRLREQLEMGRISVSEASMSLIQYVTTTKDALLPSLWGSVGADPFSKPSSGCCNIC